MGKNPENYENIRNETNIYEQKPINIDDFNEVEEKEIKKRVEKRKQKRREVADLIFTGGLLTMPASLQRTSRSVYLRPQISQRGCKMTSIIM